MITVLNLGRWSMMAWIGYALILVFEPALLRRAPDAIGGSVQAVVAFGLGYLMDRALAVLYRRKAQGELSELPPGADSGTNTDGRI
jgi:hypothetical protein